MFGVYSAYMDSIPSTVFGKQYLEYFSSTRNIFEVCFPISIYNCIQNTFGSIPNASFGRIFFYSFTYY